MNTGRLIASAVAAMGLGASAWYLTRPVEGEPPEPIALPDLPGDFSTVGPGGVPARGGDSGISKNDNEVEALARVIASEAGSGTAAEQKSIGWTVRNRFRGKSIYAKEYPWRAQKGSDPPFSSARPAADGHRKLAADIIDADQSQDPTGGATSFFEPKMQDAFAKAGAMARDGETGNRVIDGVKISDITRFKAYKKNADDLRRSWSKGSAQYATAGRFEFWGSASLLAKRGNPAPKEIAVGGLDFMGFEDIYG